MKARKKANLRNSTNLDNDTGDTHLSADSGDTDDELDRVDIVGKDDQAGLLGFDEGDNVLRKERIESALRRDEVGEERRAYVESGLDEERLLGLVGLLSISDLGGSSYESDLLLLLRLSLVLVEESEELGGGVLVEDLRELSDCRGNLETLVEDDLLSLQSDVLGPLDESGEVGSRLDRLSCKPITVNKIRRIDWSDSPIPKFLGDFSKSGFFLVVVGFAPG